MNAGNVSPAKRQRALERGWRMPEQVPTTVPEGQPMLTMVEFKRLLRDRLMHSDMLDQVSQTPLRASYLVGYILERDAELGDRLN